MVVLMHIIWQDFLPPPILGTKSNIFTVGYFLKKIPPIKYILFFSKAYGKAFFVLFSFISIYIC